MPRLENQFAVRVVFRQGKTRYGKDRGLMTFVDGWVYFEGLQTSFAMKQCELCASNYWPDRRNTNPSEAPYSFSKEIDSRDFAVDVWLIHALQVGSNRFSYPDSELRRIVGLWPRTSEDAPEGRSILFPTRPHPDAYVLPWLVAIAVVIATTGAVILTWVSAMYGSF